MRNSLRLGFVFLVLFCVVSSGFAQNWWGSIGKQFPVQDGDFSLEFDLVPRVESIKRAHITLSNFEPAGWGDNACIIRCVAPSDEEAGYMDARDGGSYLAHEMFYYDPGESYHFKMDVDAGGEIYSVTVNTVGFEDTTGLVYDIGFRTDQLGVGELQYINVTIPYLDEVNYIDDPGAELKNIVLYASDGAMVWQDEGTEYVAPPDTSSAVELRSIHLAENFSLEQNFPNPFNPSTTINFSVPFTSSVKVSVYNTLGQEVATLANQIYQAGAYSLNWDGTSQFGNKVKSGVYYYKLFTVNQKYTKKMLHLK